MIKIRITTIAVVVTLNNDSNGYNIRTNNNE